MDFNIRKTAGEHMFVVAHRGVAGGNIPCNTMTAYEIALKQGADMIETDLNTTKDGKLYDYTPAYESTPMFQNEINAFVACVQSGEKLASHIDRNILTSKLMQGIYDSSDTGREVVMD